MEINDEAKDIVQDLGAAINVAIERSSDVAAALERLREAGYETELSLRLQIGLRHIGAVDEESMANDLAADDNFETAATLELTEEDRRTLRRMRIRVDDLE